MRTSQKEEQIVILIETTISPNQDIC